jgi:hypothetical protein
MNNKTIKKKELRKSRGPHIFVDNDFRSMQDNFEH